MAKDKFGSRDGLSASITVPEGEEGLVEGLAAQEEATPDTPQPASFAVEVRQTPKGWGTYVSAQPAPLTLDNTTWHPTKEAADAAVDKLHEDFGWMWIGPTTADTYEEQPDPNDPGKMRKVRVKGEVTAPGYWRNDYGMIFDPGTLKDLIGEGA